MKCSDCEYFRYFKNDHCEFSECSFLTRRDEWGLYAGPRKLPVKSDTDYCSFGEAREAGNSVTVPVIKAIGERITEE